MLIDKETLVNLYHNKYKESSKGILKKTYLIFKEDKTNLFYFTALFSDVVNLKDKFSLLILFKSPKIVQFLIHEYFDIQTSFTDIKIDYPDKINYKKVLYFVLDLEKSHHRLFEVDPPFYKFLYKNINDRTRLYTREPSPILLELFKDNYSEGFYKFVFKPHQINDLLVDYKNTWRTIRDSKFGAIRNLIIRFYQIFPELKTIDKVLDKNRILYLKNILNVPLETKLLRTYLELYSLKEGLTENIIFKVKFKISKTIINSSENYHLIDPVLSHWFKNCNNFFNYFILNIKEEELPEDFVLKCSFISNNFNNILEDYKVIRDRTRKYLLKEAALKSSDGGFKKILLQNFMFFDQNFIQDLS